MELYRDNFQHNCCTSYKINSYSVHLRKLNTSYHSYFFSVSLDLHKQYNCCQKDYYLTIFNFYFWEVELGKWSEEP